MNTLYPNIMIDIESLGKYPGFIVFAIGFCFFDYKEIYEPTLIKISVKESKQLGFYIDPDTANWWKDPERIELCKELCKDPKTVYNGFSQLLKALVRAKTHWCWGTDFDFPLIECYFRLLNMSHYRFCLRDARTLVKLCSQSSLISGSGTIERVGMHHNPMDDAIHQSKEVQMILNSLMITGV